MDMDREELGVMKGVAKRIPQIEVVIVVNLLLQFSIEVCSKIGLNSQ
jgi:hypothetical protein